MVSVRKLKNIPEISFKRLISLKEEAFKIASTVIYFYGYKKNICEDSFFHNKNAPETGVSGAPH